VVVPTGVPTFGVCFGHQLLAQALGGEVQLNPRGREMSTVEVERSGESLIFDGVDERFQANACHVDTVVALPEGAEPLATSAGDDHQCIRFSDTCYGVQFHPEFDSEVMKGYVEARAELIAAEGLDPDAMLARASDTPMSGQVLRNFVRHYVGSGTSKA
jgi:GMP synthase (glutamine-hydrolysing)